MIKIGTDICSIQRVEAAYKQFGNKFLTRILTEDEIAYVLSAPKHTITRLAVRIAAKEATAKALGTGFKGMSWRDVEVGHHSSGAPTVMLHGRAAQRATQLGFKHWEISLSHEREYAIATVLAYTIS